MANIYKPKMLDDGWRKMSALGFATFTVSKVETKPEKAQKKKKKKD